MTPAQTPERPVTWSDEELWKAALSTLSLKPAEVWARNFLTALGAVHPAEVREREREAVQAFVADFMTLGCFLDTRLPSLLPPSPPPLVLSDGHAWTRGAKGWGYSEPCSGAMQYPVPPLRTASDAEKLAKWLRAYGDEKERG